MERLKREKTKPRVDLILLKSCGIFVSVSCLLLRSFSIQYQSNIIEIGVQVQNLWSKLTYTSEKSIPSVNPEKTVYLFCSYSADEQSESENVRIYVSLLSLLHKHVGSKVALWLRVVSNFTVLSYAVLLRIWNCR